MLPPADVDIHTSEPKFVIKYLRPPTKTGRTHQYDEGWHIVAVCDCHYGTVVSRQFHTQDEANKALGVLLNVR